MEVVCQIAPTSRSDTRGAAQAAPLDTVARPASRPTRILVAYDGSEAATRALDRAASLAGYGSALTVVSVGGNEAAAELLDGAREQLLQRQVFAQYVWRSGDPVTELLEACQRLESDLIVVGRRRQSPLRRLILGSVSAEIVNRAPCDVLVVR